MNYEFQKELAEKIIVAMSNECVNNDIDFKLVFIPTPDELNSESVNSYYDFQSFINEISKQNDIDLICTYSAFNQEKINGLELKKQGHWDAKANEIIAKHIFINLIQE